MNLIVIEANKHLINYKAMCAAIQQCDRIDECKAIVDKTVAMAAYYAQAKDVEAMAGIQKIRARAWRRLGQLIAKAVDFTGCSSQAARLRKIRATSPGDPTIGGMSDSRLREVLLVGELSEADFEHSLTKLRNGTPDVILSYTPQAEARHAVRHKEFMERTRELENDEDDDAAVAEGEPRETEDVGVTLVRKFRVEMKAVTFLLKPELHAVMRQAAFDHEITMQSVLRRGLRLWLEAHKYAVPDEGE